jgi:hypothetical protein
LVWYIIQIRELGNVERLVGEPFCECCQLEEEVGGLRKLIAGFGDLKPGFNDQD